jgi:hypothetical protein
VAYLKIISQHLPGGTEKTTRNLSQNSRPQCREFNLGPPEYEREVLESEGTQQPS